MLFAAVALVAPFAVNADSIVTGTIAAPTPMNGLTFSNIGCTLSSDGGAASNPNSCTGISASNITVPGNGISFTSGFSATAGSFEDAALTYTVSSTSGITAVGLDFNGYFEGLGVTSVTETIYSGSTMVANLTVDCGNGGCSPAQESQNIVLNGSYTDLNVVKDIDVSSGSKAPGNYAGLSVVDQTFTTTPEPASLALIGAGLLAAGAFRRKMVKA